MDNQKKIVIGALALAVFAGSFTAFYASNADAFFAGGKKPQLENVEHTVEKIDDGVVKTLTTSDADTLEKLQSKEAREPKNDAVSVVKENIENGVRITETTSDAEVLERMHDRVDHHELKQTVNHSVENIKNGVVVMITSENAEAVEMIQQHSEKKGERGPENVDFSSENIQNGVRVTITSSDAEEVARIQEHAQNPEMHRGGKRGMQGGKHRGEHPGLMDEGREAVQK